MDRSTDNTNSHNPFTYMLREAFEGMMRSLMFCLPGRVLSFNATDQTAQIQCGIQRIINDVATDIPVIDNVPVQFPGNGQFYFWHEITAGTEGLIHFCERALDTWLDQGGSVAPHDTRILSVTDAFFIPGVRSRPGKIPNFVNTGAGMSSYDRNTLVRIHGGNIELKAATVTINSTTTTVNASGNFNVIAGAISLQGATTITGATAIVGNTGVTGTMNNNGTNIGSTHTHTQAVDSHGDTQPNTGVPI